MRFPMTDEKHVREDEAIEMLRYGIDNGINYIDTAWFYCGGESEIVVGKALKDGYREKVVLSTKNPIHEPDGEKWRRRLEEQLKKLDTDVIDVYHFHGINWKDWNENLIHGPAQEMRRAQDEGLIRHRAFSFHDSPENLIKLIDTDEFEGVLLQYNLLDRANEEGIDYAAEKGLGVVVMGPVAGGRLAAPSDEIGKLMPMNVQSTPDAALRFVIGNPNVTVALSGMSNLREVRENIATANSAGPLTDEQKDQIQRNLSEVKALADLYCTGCKYCMPCPNDVDIARNFELMNYYRVWGLEEYAKMQYAKLREKKVDDKVIEAWAEACLGCGECEPKCPQNIPIVDRLAEVAETLGE
jgi:predicted aldo/keto reductase-like oxidoreductase